ncbi:HNH endonuclease [Paraburkholderia azotifigens]|uniref:HNH endonuclease n=1 Tax=Paraburkholderia azotifigens TaxID=2057004 RepID=UPI003179F96E
MRVLKSPLAVLSNRVAIAGLSWREGKNSSAARGYGYDWQRLRAGHLAKHPYCAYCLRDLDMCGMTPAEVIVACATRGIPEPIGSIGDHIVPHEGDESLRLDPNNVQTLCKRHHDGEKQRRERAAR